MDGEGKHRALKKLSQGYTANLVWLQKLPFTYHAVLSLKEKDLFRQLPTRKEWAMA